MRPNPRHVYIQIYEIMLLLLLLLLLLLVLDLIVVMIVMITIMIVIIMIVMIMIDITIKSLYGVLIFKGRQYQEMRLRDITSSDFANRDLYLTKKSGKRLL